MVLVANRKDVFYRGSFVSARAGDALGCGLDQARRRLGTSRCALWHRVYGIEYRGTGTEYMVWSIGFMA